MYAHRIKETTQTVGTGDLVLNGSLAGYRRFSYATLTPARIHYLIEWDGGFEVGFGEFDGQDRISRLFIISNSVSGKTGDFEELGNTGQPFNLPAGIKTVSLIAPAAGYVACSPALAGDALSDFNAAPRAPGARSTAAGWGAFADGHDSVALGFGARAWPKGSIRLGYGDALSPNSLSFGTLFDDPADGPFQSADSEFVVSECIVQPALQGELAGPAFPVEDQAWVGEVKLLCIVEPQMLMIKCDVCVFNEAISVGQISTVFGSLPIQNQDISFSVDGVLGSRLIIQNNQPGQMRVGVVWTGLRLGWWG